ncbi:MAG TPA: nicotinamidase [Burkholderiales bacterium]|nr:nicotinamidase [Burkholderiales bacterium]
MSKTPASAVMVRTFEAGDALLVVDVQRDFLPGGALAVPHGDAVVPVLNRYIALAEKSGNPVFASRDWHPENHCSFRTRGGRWPPHCVAETDGARFAPGLQVSPDIVVVSKGTDQDAEAYSAFSGTNLAATLKSRGVRRLWIGGLATDYCVLETVLSARRAGFDVFLLQDATRAVDVNSGDGATAVARMIAAGVVPVDDSQIAQ